MPSEENLVAPVGRDQFLSQQMFSITSEGRPVLGLIDVAKLSEGRKDAYYSAYLEGMAILEARRSSNGRRVG